MELPHGRRSRPVVRGSHQSAPVNDTEDRELTISCGAALFNLRVAAAAAGWDPKVSMLPEPEDPDLLARVDLADGYLASDADRSLAAAIDLRYTHRKRFQDREVPGEVVARLQAAADAEGAWLKVVADDQTRDRIGDLVEQGDRAQFADPRWRRELAAWMHPRRRGDGLVVSMSPITAYGIPRRARHQSASQADRGGPGGLARVYGLDAAAAVGAGVRGSRSEAASPTRPTAARTIMASP